MEKEFRPEHLIIGRDHAFKQPTDSVRDTFLWKKTLAPKSNTSKKGPRRGKGSGSDRRSF